MGGAKPNPTIEELTLDRGIDAQEIKRGLCDLEVKSHPIFNLERMTLVAIEVDESIESMAPGEPPLSETPQRTKIRLAPVMKLANKVIMYPE